jgi:hypothetical protein
VSSASLLLLLIHLLPKHSHQALQLNKIKKLHNKTLKADRKKCGRFSSFLSHYKSSSKLYRFSGGGLARR